MNHPPMLTCPYCGTDNQNNPENEREDCWKCHLPIRETPCTYLNIQTRDPSRHFKGCPRRGIKDIERSERVTAEELFLAHYAVTKKEFPTLRLGESYWFQISEQEKRTWEALAKMVNSKPSFVRLRLEAKVAESAAKWWKVEEWLKSHTVEEFVEQDDFWSAFGNFIVKLSEEK